MADNYAFVRDTRNSPSFANLQSAGWTPLVAYNDPGLAQYMAAAHAAGVNPGIWGDPGQLSAQQFAQTMGALGKQYGASALVPDIEFVGKGYQGSAGWDYNQQLANYWKQYAGGMKTALTPMGNQHDFNYGAWKDIVSQWLPQSYGAQPQTEQYDPQQIMQVLIDEGIDPSQITPAVFGSANMPYALYTADDFAANLPQAFRGNAPVPTAARTVQSSSQPSAPAPPPAQRVSQSASQIQSQGLSWGGRTFNNASQLRTYLASRGRETYAQWQANHPTAAQALLARTVAQRSGKAG